jgi:hypothetical protein
VQAGPPSGRGKLATYLGFLIEIVDSIPDITLREQRWFGLFEQFPGVP